MSCTRTVSAMLLIPCPFMGAGVRGLRLPNAVTAKRSIRAYSCFGLASSSSIRFCIWLRVVCNDSA